ncbi:TRAP transporter large permease [Vibrio tetraodonis]|uniref:TRAP transporter large permease n=1 Tax=Vibrio tetraodonis TaxID=2231647 RepID=UPI000E0C24EC|nr:TRAP transporter large permease [Vibrio tetraodonis]
MIVSVLLVLLFNLFLGVPIFISLLVSSILFFFFLDTEIAFRIIPQQFFSGIDSFSLMAIPLFILAGNLLNESGLTPKLMSLSKVLVGHLKGGTGYVNIISSIFFSGVNGSAVADTSVLGTLLVPAMKKEGYSVGFAASLTAGSSLIGPIIPPSIFMIIYASLTNTPVGDLFLAGITPGLTLGVILFIANWRYAEINELKSFRCKPSLKHVFTAIVQAFPALIAPILIVLSIISGFVTPAESGSIIVLYTLIIGLVLRTLKWSSILKAFIDTAKLTTAIFVVIASSSVLTWLLGFAQVPAAFTSLFIPFFESPTIILFVLSGITFFVGMLMEEVSALILLTPVFIPIATYAGIDPIHLGIVVTMNITIALITPPMGACLYVASAVSKIDLEIMFREIIPFIFYALLILLLVILVPDFVLFIPKELN